MKYVTPVLILLTSASALMGCNGEESRRSREESARHFTLMRACSRAEGRLTKVVRAVHDSLETHRDLLSPESKRKLGLRLREDAREKECQRLRIHVTMTVPVLWEIRFISSDDRGRYGFGLANELDAHADYFKKLAEEQLSVKDPADPAKSLPQRGHSEAIAASDALAKAAPLLASLCAPGYKNQGIPTLDEENLHLRLNAAADALYASILHPEPFLKARAACRYLQERVDDWSSEASPKISEVLDPANPVRILADGKIAVPPAAGSSAGR